MSRLGPTKGVAMRVPKVAAGTRKPAAQTSRLGGKAGGDDGYLYVAGIRDPSHKVTEYRVSGLCSLARCNPC